MNSRTDKAFKELGEALTADARHIEDVNGFVSNLRGQINTLKSGNELLESSLREALEKIESLESKNGSLAVAAVENDRRIAALSRMVDSRDSLLDLYGAEMRAIRNARSTYVFACGCEVESRVEGSGIFHTVKKACGMRSHVLDLYGIRVITNEFIPKDVIYINPRTLK